MNEYLKKIKKQILQNEADQLKTEQDTQASFQPENITSIAVVFFCLIGDNIIYSGIYKQLKKKFIHAKITIYCRNFIKEIYSNNPFVDEAIAWNGSLPLTASYAQEKESFYKTINGKQYDLVLNFHYYGRNRGIDEYILNMNAKYRIASEKYYDEANPFQNIANKQYSFLVSDIWKNRNPSMLEYSLHFLQAIGINTTLQDIQPKLYLNDADLKFADSVFEKYNLDPEKTICVAMKGSTISSAFNTYDKYGEILINIADNHNYSIIALGTNDDYKFVEDSFSNKKLTYINLCGQTTIMQSAGIIKKSKMIVGADTGLLHVACAVKTPNVVMVSSRQIGRFFPYSPMTSAVYLPLACMNCETKCKYNYPVCIQKINPYSLIYAIEYTLHNELKNPRVFYQQDTSNLYPAKWEQFDKTYFMDNVEVIKIPQDIYEQKFINTDIIATPQLKVELNNHTVTVSVIIPLYNYAHFIEETVHSVINQTYKNWEIIICDDCSTDNSYQVAVDLMNKYSQYNIIIIQNSKNSGLCVTRNAAIREAKGKYILPLDADDTIEPTMLEECINIMVNENADIVYSNYTCFQDSNEQIPAGHPTTFINIYYYNLLPVCSLFRKEMWEKVGGYSENLLTYEDWELWIKFHKHGFTNAVKIDKSLFNYRKHGRSLADKGIDIDNKLKAQMILNNTEAYHKYYILWAEGILTGNTEYRELSKITGEMPDFINLLICFEKYNLEFIKKELQDKYIPAIQKRQFNSIISLNLPDGNSVNISPLIYPNGILGIALPNKYQTNYEQKFINNEESNGFYETHRQTAPVTPLQDGNSYLVSVIIPLYNQGHFLEYAVGSVINQTYKNIEIIIVDDCSTDNSYQIAQELIKKYSFFSMKLLQNKINIGGAATRNVAIRNAQGEYILPLDSDDMIDPTFVEKCLDYMQHSKADIAYTDVKEFGDKHAVVPSIDFDPAILFYMNYLTATSLFKKEVWEKVGGYDEKMRNYFEDWNFWISAVSLDFRGVRVPEVLFFYRKIGSGETYNIKKENKVSEICAYIILAHKEFYDSNYIRWAEEVQKGNPKAIAMGVYGIMPILGDWEQIIAEQKNRLNISTMPIAVK